MLLLVSLLAGGCSNDVDLDPPSAGQTSTGEPTSAAQSTLDHLVDALDDRSSDDAEAAAVPDMRGTLANIAANARSLDLRDLSMRYVDEGAALTAEQRARFPKGAWVGTVELQYSFGGLDTPTARFETPVVFAPGGSRVRIAAFGAPGERTPLWLADRLTVVRRGPTLVAVAGPAGRYPRLAQRARVQVRRTLPAWRGPLVVEVPRLRAQLDAALDAEPATYDDIAAVTTTEDGSLAPGSPVSVFVNPTVFAKLADRGAQVVMSHEATHVATGATFASMPTWLLEGFADYVALVRTDIPVTLAARQILARIRDHGLPRRLPTSADLDPTANGLGATYEEAWLACRSLADHYGEARLIAFYRAVSGGAPQGRAFRRVLGTSEREFVTRWRIDLARLAGVEAPA